MSSAVGFLGLQMWSKTAQDARQFFVRRFWGPFGFQMHLLGVKLDSFRTLESSGAPMSSAVWFLGLQMYSKTAQDARQFFVRRFWGPFGFQMHLLGVKLDPFRTLKVQWGTYALRRLVFRPSNVLKNSTGRSPICCSAVLGPFWVPNAPFRGQT